MRPFHIFLALGVTFLWGTNFVALKESVTCLPPFLNLALRFFGVSFPLAFFIGFPKKHWRTVIRFACFQWMIQLIFINLALQYGVSPSMVSLFIQTKSITVLVLAAVFYGYKLHKNEIRGVIISFMGIFMLGYSILTLPEAKAYLFLVPAVLSISLSHLIFKENLTDLPPLSLIVWAGTLSCGPMMILSLAFEGMTVIQNSLYQTTSSAWYALIYSIVGGNLIGTSIYVFLLKYYGPEKIVPFNVLIPLWSFIACAFFYTERLTVYQIFACSLILIGLLVNQRKPSSFQNLNVSEKTT